MSGEGVKPRELKYTLYCKKTISGKHLFMPLSSYGSNEYLLRHQIWVAHGIRNPMICDACGIIDDVTGEENTT